ncbi:YppG family protein [Bacillus sp. PS06]|uniref:YppG family protein n=1 Tax=Bacillus sp. PS06 TaxID=2764176 RepID=UPI00178464FE|nr:YppG family protein [Bacillus sp. PS06]MBD8070203.1 YppG family protein [Bacillus sp. PS06]
MNQNKSNNYYPINHQREFQSPYSQNRYMNTNFQHQYPQGGLYSHNGYQPPIGGYPYSQINPLNPHSQQGMYQQYPTPYPMNYQMTPQQASGFQSFLSQFKTEEGTYDYNKMMDTAGQMMGAVNQISGLIKGFSSAFKS